MKKSLTRYILLAALVIAFAGCSKWKDATSLVVQDLNYDTYSNPVYKEYLTHLKTYKASEHSLLLGIVNNWDVTQYNNSLSAIPDSVDMIVLQNPPTAFSDAQLDELKKVQSLKGTKILYYLSSGAISDSIKNNPDMFPDGDSAAIAIFVKNAKSRIENGNYDGIVLNMEGNVCYTCNTVFTSTQKRDYLISLVGDIAGPKSNSNRISMVQGEPKDVGSANGDYFDYFISNSSTSSYQYVEDASYELYSQFSNFSAEKFILTADFSELDKAKAGGIPFYISSDGTTVPSSLGLAGWNTPDGKKGGLAIYSVENDFGNNFYFYTRSAIGIQNPPVK